uniref:Si:dkey-43k4.3 n=1 Tax=Cyprinodon variegatus TaxID=28743 RepID=A0A3Q2E182_CYPVA
MVTHSSQSREELNSSRSSDTSQEYYLNCNAVKLLLKLSVYQNVMQSKRGADLSRISDSRPPPSKSAQHRPRMSQRRSAESCQAGNSYEREKFHPGPVRDLEKEKRRLQNIMATGTEEPETGSPGKLPGDSKQEESEETDRFQEVLNEIEERRQFLADMAALGQDHQYSSIINAEISQVRTLFALPKIIT